MGIQYSSLRDRDDEAFQETMYTNYGLGSFCIGLLGCLIVVVLLNHRQKQKESALHTKEEAVLQ